MQKCTEDKKAGSPLSMTLKSLGLGHGKCSINVLKSRDIPPTGPSLFLEPKLSLLLQFRHVWQCLCAGWKREKSESVSYSVMSSSLWLHEILQARILKWIAIFFSRGSSQPGIKSQVSWLIHRFFTIWATSETKGHPWAWGAKWSEEPLQMITSRRQTWYKHLLLQT